MVDWPFLRSQTAIPASYELEKWQATVLEILRGSADVTLRYFRQSLEVDNKLATGFDPVTIADRECEAYIDQALQCLLPAHGMFGEESGYRAGGDFTWVVDPIDGTRSFICGVPLWGTLMALNNGAEPILGGMYQPWSDELFIGSMLGAFLHRGGVQSRLQTSAVTAVSDAKVACTALDIFAPDALRCFQALASDARLVRFGTDCYGYALLAQGGVDLVVEDGLQPYDIQALIPIIEAAGGVISNWQGGSAALGGSVVAAANATLHADAMRYLAQGH